MDFAEFGFYAPNVPRETFERLHLYVDTLVKWQKQLNLISAKDVPDIWHRHILDCCQFSYALANVPRETKILDLGSGGGLPGLILAILGFDNVTLVESDGRKCVFLEETARILNLNVTVLNDRIERLGGQWPIISARGCASLSQLLTWSYPVLSSSGVCLFAKGERHAMERMDARTFWEYEEEIIASQTNAASVLLKLSHIRPVTS